MNVAFTVGVNCGAEHVYVSVRAIGEQFAAAMYDLTKASPLYPVDIFPSMIQTATVVTGITLLMSLAKESNRARTMIVRLPQKHRALSSAEPCRKLGMHGGAHHHQ